MEKKNKTCKDLSTDLDKNPGYISRIMSGKIELNTSHKTEHLGRTE